MRGFMIGLVCGIALSGSFVAAQSIVPGVPAWLRLTPAAIAPAASGSIFVCIGTTGQLVSSAAACVGT